MISLSDKDTWIFDLDNTLYPASCNLFAQIEHRMGLFIQNFLELEPVAAKKVQKDYFRTYGTTLKGLMENHDLDPHRYLDFVHDIDFSAVSSDGALNAALERLPGRKLIFTNASAKHADKVMDRLGVQHHFDGIFDIADADYVPKPAQEPYDRIIRHHNLDPKRAIFFEDSPKNLAPAAAMGMTTVWVRTDSEWGSIGATGDNGQTADYIHHATDDLVDWLNGLRTG